MSLLTKSRTAQTVLCQEFYFNFDDTMVDINGVTRDFGSLAAGSSAATIYSVVIGNLPPNAIVVGGHVARSTAFDAATYNVTIGDTAVTNRYLGSTDLKATGLTALVPTGYLGAAENLVMTFAAADACTTGAGVVRVQYILKDRVSEINTH
jgi:hypothetical protein